MSSVEQASSVARAPSRDGSMMRNVLHLGLGQVATTILTVLLSATIARTLGAADFGLLYLLMSIATFGYVFVDWGHGQYVTREVARHPERSGDLMGSVLAVRAAMAVAVCGLTVVSTWLLGYDLRTRVLAAIMIVAWLPMYLALSYSWAFRGRERMDCDAVLNVVLKFSTLVLSLVCLALGGRLLALILATAASGSIALALAISLYRRLHLPPVRVTRDTARELVLKGAPMLAIALAVTVQSYIDANVLFKLASAEVVGWYGAAWNIAGTLVAPATILGATTYPRLSRASHDPAEFKRVLQTSFRPLLVVAVLGAVGTYLFADVAVSLVYSHRKFGPSGAILRAFAPALLLIYVDMLLGNAILATGKSARLAGAKVAAVVLTTSLELFLIPFCQTQLGNGGIGIVLATTAGELVMVVAMILLIRHSIDTHMLFDFIRGLLAGAATALVMSRLSALTPFLAIPLCVAVFLGISAMIGLISRADFELLATGFRKQPAQPAIP